MHTTASLRRDHRLLLAQQADFADAPILAKVNREFLNLIIERYAALTGGK